MSLWHLETYKVDLVALQAEPLIEYFSLLQPFEGSTAYLMQAGNPGRGHTDEQQSLLRMLLGQTRVPRTKVGYR